MKLFFLLFFTTLQAQTIKIEKAWVKAVPPMLKMSAAYMTIKNTGPKSIKLLSGKSSVADYVEIHTHRKVKGVMKMRQIDHVVIDAGKSAILKPKSDHLMLIQLQRQLKVGDIVDMSLKFSSGEVISLKIPVRKLP